MSVCQSKNWNRTAADRIEMVWCVLMCAFVSDCDCVYACLWCITSPVCAQLNNICFDVPAHVFCAYVMVCCKCLAFGIKAIHWCIGWLWRLKMFVIWFSRAWITMRTFFGTAIFASSFCCISVVASSNSRFLFWLLLYECSGKHTKINIIYQNRGTQNELNNVPVVFYQWHEYCLHYND